MIDVERAKDFAHAWLSAWNRHDIDAILSHYADPPEHCSPLIIERLGHEDGTIRNREELRAYFLRGLDGAPPLRFDLIDVFPGVSSVAVMYRNHRDRIVIEVMKLNSANKVVAALVHYR